MKGRRRGADRHLLTSLASSGSAAGVAALPVLLAGKTVHGFFSGILSSTLSLHTDALEHQTHRP